VCVIYISVYAYRVYLCVYRKRGREIRTALWLMKAKSGLAHMKTCINDGDTPVAWVVAWVVCGAVKHACVSLPPDRGNLSSCSAP